MEDLKEMFAQIMRFQMESQQKNEERLFQLLQGDKERNKKTRKNNNGSSLNHKNKKHVLKV